MSTVPAIGHSWLAAEAQCGPFGNRALTQDVEVKLDRVVHNTGQIADDQVNSHNTPGAILLGCLQRYG
jgi:hypothetical protein